MHKLFCRVPHCISCIPLKRGVAVQHSAARGSFFSQIIIPKGVHCIIGYSKFASFWLRPKQLVILMTCFLVKHREWVARTYDVSSLLLVIITHAKELFIHTAGKSFLCRLTLWDLLLWWGPSGQPTLVRQCPMLQATSSSSLGWAAGPIKGHFTWWLLVFCTTTTRV